MKKILIVRLPEVMPEKTRNAYEVEAKKWATDSYDVIIVSDNVERIEFEIVYDPHLKLGQDEPAYAKLDIKINDAIRFAIKPLVHAEHLDETVAKIHHEFMTLGL